MREEKKLTGYPSIDKPWLKYYPVEAESVSIPEKTAFELVFDKQKNNPKPALIYLGQKVSFKKLFSKIEDCAKAFQAAGIKSNDIVTVALPLIPETVYIFYALNRIGAVSNFIDPRLKPNEFVHSMVETDSRMLLVADLFVDTAIGVKKDLADLQVVFVSPLESASPLLKVLSHKNKSMLDFGVSWTKFIEQGSAIRTLTEEKFIKNKPATIVHTGGTTGLPKGVMLTNENFNAMALTQEISDFGFESGDSILTFLPPFIAYCLVNAIHDPLYLGWKNTLIPKFEYTDFPELVMKYKPNHILGGPILWDNFIKSPLTQKSDLSFLKSPISGGDSMNIELERQINAFLLSHNCDHKIMQGYGMTEVSAAACFSSDRSYCEGSVGIPYVKNTISIFDVETNNELSYGNEGEVCIQSPTMMSGYFHNPDATSEIIKTHSDGSTWLHTGDCGVMNEYGNLFIKGRMKRMIVRSGNKIFPTSIEAVILRNKNVSNCAVVQMAHECERHVPVAFLVLKNPEAFDETVSELNQLIESELPEFNIPYKYFIKDELPLTGINKIDFRVLEKEAEKL